MSFVSNSVASHIQHWAGTRPNDLALLFLDDGENESARLSFGDLHDQAERLSGRIIRAGLSGRTILLPAFSDPDFVVALCACLLAGAIAVPSPFLVRNRGQERIRSIARDAGVAAVIGGTGAGIERL